MNIIEAIQALQAGKKIRRPFWTPTNYIFLNEKKYIVGRWPSFRLTSMINDNNWELYQPKSIIPFDKLPAGKVAKFVETDIYLVKVDRERPDGVNTFNLIMFEKDGSQLNLGASFIGLMVEYPVADAT